MGRNSADEIITIDGPAGAGKSTVSKLLAKRLGYVYLDTGAMYRAVAVLAQKEGIQPEDETALEKLCRHLDILFQESGANQKIFCQGEDVTERIRDPQIGWLASNVSMRRSVRQAMVNLQRKIGEKGKVVAEGRDTGTVVFPQAKYKFFLIADPQERARRRYRELKAKGVDIIIEEVKEEMEKRDMQDSSRELAPLRPAKDAKYIDSTNLTTEEVIEEIIKAINERERSNRALL